MERRNFPDASVRLEKRIRTPLVSEMEQHARL